MKRFLVSLFAMAFLLAGVGTAGAVGFTLDSYDLTYNDSDPGLVLQVANILPEPYSFNLEVGQTTGPIDLFRLWTNESAVNSSDDIYSKPFTVDMNFSAPPPPFDGTVEGETYGYRAPWGIIQGGEVEWDNPTPLYFGTGGTGVLMVTLSDSGFNYGLFGTTPGYCWGTNVTATFTYATAPIPEPGTMLLLGMGVLGVGLVGRKKLMKK